MGFCDRCEVGSRSEKSGVSVAGRRTGGGSTETRINVPSDDVLGRRCRCHGCVGGLVKRVGQGRFDSRSIEGLRRSRSAVINVVGPGREMTKRSSRGSRVEGRNQEKRLDGAIGSWGSVGSYAVGRLAGAESYRVCGSSGGRWWRRYRYGYVRIG